MRQVRRQPSLTVTPQVSPGPHTLYRAPRTSGDAPNDSGPYALPDHVAGFTRFLHAEGVTVVEVNRPNRQLRRSHGKSDPVDAVAAARAAQSGQATGQAKTRDGAVEAIRALRVARRSASRGRITAINQMRALLVSGPDDLRETLQGSTVLKLVRELRAARCLDMSRADSLGLPTGTPDAERA